MIKVAVIGIGGISAVHLPAYKLLENTTLVAAADAEVEKARKKVGGSVPVYDSIDVLLEQEDVDMVDICVPTFLHKEIALKAMKQGKHVLCEKPMAMTAEEAQEMIDAAKENKVNFMVAHVIRFWEEYEYLKNVYDSKQYGELLEADFYRYSGKSNWSWNNWLLQKEKGGFVELDLHIHDVDYIRYLLGEPNTVKSTRKENEFMEVIEVHYEFENDAMVRSESGWFGTEYEFNAGFRVVFEHAMLEYKAGILKLFEEGKKSVELQLAKEDNLVDTGININAAKPYFNEIKYFTDCIEKKEAPIRCLPESAKKSVELVYEEIDKAIGRKK